MYFCKACGELDQEDMYAHRPRCNPKVVNVVVNAKPLVVNKKEVLRVEREPVEVVPDAGRDKPLVVPPSSRSKDRHKNKVARLEYARNWMRRRRAAKVQVA
jgi:hypothetical protein